jgi:cysteine-S-conjugate beta-lyase
MAYDFDSPPERRRTDSMKWARYGPEVLPLWVADMDFRVPEPVRRALHERVEHGLFGYSVEPAGLIETLGRYLLEHHGWQVPPESIVLLPGVMPGVAMACRAFARPGDGVLVQPPVYPPLFLCPMELRLRLCEAPLAQGSGGAYEVDWSAFEGAIDPRTRMLFMSNPHNPLGRVFRREELARMAETCLRHKLVIISDEIHCDLVFGGHRHVPIASVDPKVAARTITLMAPSKSFNLAGLKMAFAVIPNPKLREKFLAMRQDRFPWWNILGCVGMDAAYREGKEWLQALRGYLEANRDFLADFVRERLPGVRMASPEGTYLAWLDCREAGIEGTAYDFFLERARVALNPGESFGQGGAGFARLNFGCSRALLHEALERMRQALEAARR